MIRAITFLALGLTTGPAFADCTAMLAREAEGAAALFSPDAATCQTARQTTGEALFCYSEHPFRSDTALARAAALEATLIECFGDAVDISQDVIVNHPDSYDAQHFDVEGARISLSVKDKGALGKTLVFLRIAERD